MQIFGLLRKVDTNELEMMLAWRNAPNVRENMYTRHKISLEEHLEWWGRAKFRGDQQYFMYEYNGRPAGVVGFTDIDEVSAVS